jgi:hypothetical protein
MDTDTDNSNPEPRRSGRVRKPTRDKASQLSQEAAMAMAKTEGTVAFECRGTTM